MQKELLYSYFKAFSTKESKEFSIEVNGMELSDVVTLIDKMRDGGYIHFSKIDKEEFLSSKKASSISLNGDSFKKMLKEKVV